MERFKRDFRVDVHSLNDEEIVFDLIGIDAALANAFRRILIAEVPTMAIEKVFILNNTSMIQDEVLAHRLGLIPINADPRKFHSRQSDEDANEENVISFRLKAECVRQQPDPGGGSEPPCINSRVVSGDLLWIPQGNQGARFEDTPIRPVHDDILIAKLRPGQAIEFEAWCEKGVGKTHAKWSPVCTASYRLLPDIVIPPVAGGDDAAAPAASTVFDVANASTPVARPRKCTMNRACNKQAEWGEKVQMTRKRDHFIFTVETTGALPPEVLFQEAVKVLMQKASDTANLLKDVVAGQGGSVHTAT